MKFSKAERFLALLQRSEHDGVDPTAFAEEFTRRKAAVREKFASLGYPMDLVDKAVKEFDFDPSSPFQQPEDKTIIPEIVNELESGIRANGLESHLLPKDRPIFGTLRTGEVNAMTIKVPNANEFVVVLEAQLFIFANLIGKALAPAFAITERGLDLNYERLESRLSENHEVTNRFAEVALAYAQHGQPNLAPQYVAEPAHGLFAANLAYSMERFVIGHEYGHVVNGDLSDGSTHLRRALAGHDVETFDYSWKQEFRADQHGLTMSMLSAIRPDRAATGSAAMNLLYASGGGDLFFTATDIMDRATSLLRTGDETRTKIGSHPPSADRRILHRECLKILMSRRLRARDDDLEAFVRFSRCLELAAEHLWSRTRPLIANAHDAGVRPAADWHQTKSP
jgi:hypothetical protein